MLKKGIIRKFNDDWINPIRFIEKLKEEVRLVSNLMVLNILVRKEPFKIKNMREVILSTSGSIWFSILILKEAFYYIEIEEEDKHNIAFKFDGTVYEWCDIIMSLKTVPKSCRE